MEQDRDFLHRQLIKLGDMMGDGLHHEKDGAWISKEYNKIYKALYPGDFPKKDFTKRNESVSRWCESNSCKRCGNKLKQSRSGSLRVICTSCRSKFQLSVKQ